jgi:hypothetical protein
MSSLPKGLLNQKIRGKVFAQLIGVLRSSGGEMDFVGFLFRENLGFSELCSASPSNFSVPSLEDEGKGFFEILFQRMKKLAIFLVKVYFKLFYQISENFQNTFI